MHIVSDLSILNILFSMKRRRQTFSHQSYSNPVKRFIRKMQLGLLIRTKLETFACVVKESPKLEIIFIMLCFVKLTMKLINKYIH